MNLKVIFPLSLFIILIGCKKDTTSPNEQPQDFKDFSIFLLKDTTLTTMQAKIIPLDSLIIDDNSLLSIDEIISYTWPDHSFELTKEGSDKFKSVNSKIKSTYGLPFIVLVGSEKIYLGNMHPIFSSYMHTDLPYIYAAPIVAFRIERAPDTTIVDKRSDPRIYKALETRKKLK